MRPGAPGLNATAGRRRDHRRHREAPPDPRRGRPRCSRAGFHTCRVSDIADEAGVAYGLVYHYFSSKEQILDTLFLDRWGLMLAAIAEADASPLAPRDKLPASPASSSTPIATTPS